MFTIIIDTKEKQPWSFESYVTDNLVQLEHHSLKTGDYTVKGIEDKICIERKKSVAELAQNITTKRFFNELERMSNFAHPFLVLEFSVRHIDTFPANASLPPKIQKRIKITGNFIIKKINEIFLKYNIHVLFCDNRYYAEYMCYDLLKRTQAKYD